MCRFRQVLGLMMVLQGCRPDTAPHTAQLEPSDTLSYTVSRLDRRAPGCAVEDSFCAHVRITYPAVAGSQKLARAIEAELISLASPLDRDSGTGRSLEGAAEAFLDSFEVAKARFLKDNPSEALPPWTLDISARIYVWRDLVFLEARRDLYLGGAMDFPFFLSQAFELKTGRRIGMEDILLSKAKLTALTQLAALQGSGLIRDTQASQGSELPVPLPEMWGIHHDSLMFIYNKGEQGSGYGEYVCLPLSAVDSLLDPKYRKSHNP